MHRLAGSGATHAPSRWRRLVWPLVVCGPAAIVWWPIVGTYFFADDFVWMLRFANEPVADVLLAVFGGHVLVVRNLVYSAAYVLFGFEPAPYAATVLVTHVINVWLLFVVVRAMTGDRTIAVLAAWAWGLSPTCAGTINWYSVYGQVLVATALLAVLASMARSEEVPDRRGMAWWWLALLLSSLCFGVGLAVAAVFPALLFLLRPATLRRRGMALAAVSLPLAVAAAYFGLRQLAAWRGRLTGIEVSVLNQAFSSWASASLVEMTWRMFAIGTEAVIAGGWSPAWRSRGSGSLELVAGVVALAAAVVLADRRRRARQIAAALLVCAAAYGVIAAGRANLYAAMKMSAIAAAGQARYQYVGTIGTAILLALIVDGLRRVRHLVHLPAVLLAAWVVGAGTALYAGRWRVDQRLPMRHEVEGARAAIERAIDAAQPGDEVRIENVPFSARVLGPGLRLVDFPGRAALFVLLHPTDVVRGRRVRFVERDPGLLNAVQRTVPNTRLAQLIVPGA